MVEQKETVDTPTPSLQQEKDESLDAVSCTSSEDHERELSQDEGVQRYKYTDYSDATVEEAPHGEAATKGLSGGNLFPFKLHDILSRPELVHIVRWQPHGRSFKVLNRGRMEREVLPKFFDTGNYNSFVRLLNAWQFRRKRCPSTEDKSQADDDFNSYYHESFLRTKAPLLKKLQRLPRYNGKKLPMDPKDEPDFSQYPPLPEDSCSSQKYLVKEERGAERNVAEAEIKSSKACSKKRKTSDATIESSSKKLKPKDGAAGVALPLSGSRIPLEIRMAAAASLFGISMDEDEKQAATSGAKPSPVLSSSTVEKQTDKAENKKKTDRQLTPKKEESARKEPARKATPPSPLMRLMSDERVHLRHKRASEEVSKAERQHALTMLALRKSILNQDHLPPRPPLSYAPPMPSYGAQQPIFVVVPVSHPADTQNAVAAAAAELERNPMAFLPRRGHHLSMGHLW